MVQVYSSGVNWLHWLVFTCKEISILNPLIQVTQFLVSACEGLTNNAALLDYEKPLYDDKFYIWFVCLFIFLFNCLNLVVCCTGCRMCLPVPDVCLFLWTKQFLSPLTFWKWQLYIIVIILSTIILNRQHVNYVTGFKETNQDVQQRSIAFIISVSGSV